MNSLIQLSSPHSHNNTLAGVAANHTAISTTSKGNYPSQFLSRIISFSALQSTFTFLLPWPWATITLTATAPLPPLSILSPSILSPSLPPPPLRVPSRFFGTSYTLPRHNSPGAAAPRDNVAPLKTFAHEFLHRSHIACSSNFEASVQGIPIPNLSTGSKWRTALTSPLHPSLSTPPPSLPPSLLSHFRSTSHPFFDHFSVKLAQDNN